MAEIKFSNNYRDLSEEDGARAGFQFEFYCERCGDAWRSEFVPFTAGQTAEWVGKAAGMFGGILGNVSDVADSVSDKAFGTEQDKAFQAAVAAAEAHFHRCPKCTDYFCDKCWNVEAGLCLTDAPSAEVEIESAFAQGKVQAAGEKAALQGIHEGKHTDVKERSQLVCPSCGAETRGAKFCPECGQKLAQKAFCAQCGAAMPAEAKFCPECGVKKE
ncbi:MAG: zinc ribbon domain-containing protein [Actinobacteria bacterium]|nr:zinc ribbon domain-containing protein [Actinomycetota bacterium]